MRAIAELACQHRLSATDPLHPALCFEGLPGALCMWPTSLMARCVAARGATAELLQLHKLIFTFLQADIYVSACEKTLTSGLCVGGQLL